jgi:hypothetical protein
MLEVSSAIYLATRARMCLPEVPSPLVALSTMIFVYLFFGSLVYTLVAGAIAFATSVTYNLWMNSLLLDEYHRQLQACRLKPFSLYKKN